MEEQDRIELELVTRELARRSFPHFCEYVYGWPAFNDKGLPFVPIHHEWLAHIKACWAEGVGAGIMAPRYHGKTQQIARAMAVFELGRSTEPDLAWRPNIRVKLFQNVDTKAQATLAQIKADIEHNAALKRLFPRMKPDRTRRWRADEFFLERTANLRDGSFEAHGILSTLTSGRSDLTILDDICDLKTSVQEPASRKKVVEALTADVLNLGGPHTRLVDIGTAWHEEDANALLQTDPELSKGWSWKVYRIQDEPDGAMQVLWPDMWDLPALEARRDLIGAREFERQFNNRPYTKGERAFSWEAIKACFDDTIAPGQYQGSTPVRVGGYDLATSLKDDASRFVAFMLGMTPDKKYVPLEIIRGQVSVPTQEDTVVAMHERWTPAVHRVENNAYQDALVQYLAVRPKKPKGLKVEGYMTGKQKFDPMVGVPSLAPSFEAGQWIIPTKGGHDGQGACGCPYCTWLRELKNFPAGLIDTVMGCWFAFDKIRGLVVKPAKPKGYGERQFKRERMPRGAI